MGPDRGRAATTNEPWGQRRWLPLSVAGAEVFTFRKASAALSRVFSMKVTERAFPQFADATGAVGHHVEYLAVAI